LQVISLKSNKISYAEFMEKFNDELSYRELAAHFSIAIPTVQKYVKRLHLPKKEKIDNVIEERLTKLWQAGYSCSKIGRELGLCGTTISRIARKMGLSERELNKLTKKVSYTVVCSGQEDKPIISILKKQSEQAEKTRNNTSRFVVPPTLAELRKRNEQAEIAKAERDYKIYKRIVDSRLFKRR
jgi:hypothetical protein